MRGARSGVGRVLACSSVTPSKARSKRSRDRDSASMSISRVVMPPGYASEPAGLEAPCPRLREWILVAAVELARPRKRRVACVADACGGAEVVFELAKGAVRILVSESTGHIIEVDVNCPTNRGC